ncbi:MAG: ROK family protein [Anaerolineales bacterium]|nr:ROK family protein [Anaerolineales bacterium]
MQILGVDIGGSGIKAAPVDTATGELLAPRHRIPTPSPSKPKAVAGVVGDLVEHFDWRGPMGCGFPSVIQNGIVRTAANVHNRWIDMDAVKLFSKVNDGPVFMVNDADAAGMAEMKFGAGRGKLGTVIMITIGTGLGSAVFTHGRLVPNTEFGHVITWKGEAETIASDAARKRERLSWKKWGRRFNRYLKYMHSLFWPDLFVLGGGVAKKFEKFEPYINVESPVVPASFQNEAGIVGAALVAAQRIQDVQEYQAAQAV